MSKKTKKRGLLVVVSGPSGVGKSTVVKHLLKTYPKLKISVSVTTRPPRPGEKKGQDYTFLTEKEFFEWEKKGQFIEWAQVHQYYYGTPRQLVDEELSKNHAVVLEVDVQGAESIKKHLSKGSIKAKAAVFIFLIPPSVDILAFRLKKRKTEDTEALNYRLRAAIAELQVMEKYDYIVVNDKIESAAEKVKAIINVEKERVLLN
ncbi:guanylate kinase [Candidatus Margulisiibacteriota bacterium]